MLGQGKTNGLRPKCDEAKPACSRCVRLKVQCAGSGQRRYVWKHELSQTSLVDVPAQPERSAMTICRVPPAASAKRVEAFTHVLAVTDARFHISCYGDLMNGLPMRLGYNACLDAASDAIVVNYSDFRNQRRSPEAYASFSNAISKLRACLHDQTLATKPETLCAIYLCMICEGWLMESADTSTHHGEAMVHVMRAALRDSWHGEFEAELLTTMCVPVVSLHLLRKECVTADIEKLIESLYNPNIELDSWIWKLIDMYHPLPTVIPQPVVRPDSLSMRSLVTFVVYMRNPAIHLEGICSAYVQVLLDVQATRKTLSGLEEVLCKTKIENAREERIRAVTKTIARVQTAFGLLLAIAMWFNHALSHAEMGSDTLKEEFASLAHETISNAEEALRHRPLGASAHPFGLMVVWAYSKDDIVNSQTEQLLAQYQTDFPRVHYLELASKMQKTHVT